MEKHIPASLDRIFERSHHPYLMWEAIQSIPESLTEWLGDKTSMVCNAAQDMVNRSPVHLVGCGTSYFAGLAIAHALQRIAGVEAYAWDAFEFLAYPPAHLAQSTVLAISHTGDTPVVLKAVQMAREIGALTVGITDAEESSLKRAAHHAIISAWGLEPALPKTRSYVSSLLRGYLLAVELGRALSQDVTTWEQALKEAPRATREILTSCEVQTRALAAKWFSARRFVTVGGGPLYSAALEGMLKITETALSNATTWEVEEAAHGLWVSTTDQDLIIGLAMEGPSLESMLRLAQAMKIIGTRVWLITDVDHLEVDVDAITYLPLRSPSFELFLPLYAILPLYQFSYFMALEKGISPDAMNLSDPRYLQARMLLRHSVSQ
jgi:glucosamine--fructose-6-phosphate aminotransferase (isomerizing)